jgi:hypothetical protein
MARGMANGEAIQSQAATEEYRENHDRIFGDRKPCRGKWVMTPEGLVPVEDYVPPDAEAKFAPIIADRIREGQTFHDGDRVVDIGSRRKLRDYLKSSGLAEASDYGPGWGERQKAKIERERDQHQHKAFDQAARMLHNKGKLPK